MLLGLMTSRKAAVVFSASQECVSASSPRPQEEDCNFFCQFGVLKMPPQRINSYLKIPSPGVQNLSLCLLNSFFCPLSHCSLPWLPFESGTLSACRFPFLGCGFSPFVFIAGMRSMASLCALQAPCKCPLLHQQKRSYLGLLPEEVCEEVRCD